MFSGFRSILFGDAETQPPVDATSTNELMQSDETNHRAAVNETTKAPPSVSLEQTLNAATTKFTEQLLPQQASIEQLQSSSHQLLPSLNEQQEQQVVEIVAQKCEKYMKDDDDDDELIADSWELLDLVESKLIDDEDQDDDGIQIIYNEQPGSNADVNEQQQQLCKSTSGILKSSNNGSVKQQQQQQARQKPKVSFNTPDLVKNKRQNNNKIERASGSKQVANKSTDKPQANKATGKANKKDKQATRRANKLAKKPSKPLNNLPSNQISAKSDTEDVVPYLSGPKEDIKDNNQATSLNYAAAVLASKQNLDPTSEAIEKGEQQELAVAQGNGGGEDLQPIKSIKRHRVNSNDNIASNYEYLKAVGVDGRVEVNDDTESIMSSGFSDCDYEFKGLDDYVMRPKRNITKRGRNKSTNLSQYAKRKSASSSGPSKSSDGNKNNKVDGGLSDMAPKFAVGSPSKASKAINKKRRELDGSSTDVLKADDNHKQQPATGSSCNSNDSSDVADMDESWYVTPPPCFTGANRLNSTDNDDEDIGGANGHKQAANKSNLSMISETPASAALIENALIEHPSIYIASTSTSSKTKDVFVGENFKKSPTNKKTQPKSIVLRKVKLRRESATKAAEQSHDSGSNKLFKVCSRDDVVANEDEALMSDDLDEFWSDGPAKRRQVAVKSKQQVVASELAAVKCEQPIEVVEQEKSKSDSKVATVAASSSSSKPIRKSTGGKPAQVYKQLAPSSSGSSIGFSSATIVAVNQNKSTVAWRNKFIVDDWDLDDQEDPTTSDFDVLFEPVRKKKAVAKSKRKQQKLQVCATPSPPPLEQPGAVVELDDDVISANLGDESIQADSQMESTTAMTASSDEAELDEPAKENEQPAGSLPEDKFALLVTSVARKPATQVKPIEPERKPGWQLKRQRSKRRCSASLSNGSPASGKTTTTLEHEQQQQQRRRLAKSSSSSSSLASSPTSVVGGALEETNGNSARSTPTLIDRIGSSIVANLSNLTGGFVPVNAMLIQAATSPSGSNARNLLLLDQHHNQHNSASGGGVLGEQRNRQQQQQQALASRADKLATVGEARANRLVARKQLARNSLRRQNGVACGQSSQRRADRRLRMFARPNGCSVNRKVQTNY